MRAVWLHNRRGILSLRHPDLSPKAGELELRWGKGPDFGKNYVLEEIDITCSYKAQVLERQSLAVIQGPVKEGLVKSGSLHRLCWME